jgi:hypothetical protein
MSFTRLQYDTCQYKQELGDNVSVLGYLLDPIKYDHCTPCRNEIGLVGGNNVSRAGGNLVDLENDLFGITRETSKCAAQKYLPRPDENVQGKAYNKVVQYPVVSTQPAHLKSCQMFGLPGVPAPPPMKPFVCQKW